MKKVTILFSDAHLSYSPTVIGLYDELSHFFDVTIVARDPKYFDGQSLPGRKVVYVDESSNRLHRFASRIITEKLLPPESSGIPGFRYGFGNYRQFVKDYLDRENPDIIIAVDFKNLFVTQTLNRRVEFLSLEIVENDRFRGRCNLANIDSVLIQSKERLQHLFPDQDFKTFYIQNAPVYTPSKNAATRHGHVYCGTAWDAFGFYHLLKYLREYGTENLTVKGAVLEKDRRRVSSQFSDLLSEERLILDTGYVENKELVDYLRRFEIGFCFYNFGVEWVRAFNYYTAPSGKMFTYFAAGVPVVGIDIPGLAPVREFDCGVLISDLKPQSIAGAVSQIRSNFDYYSKNCLQAAEHYSFDKAVEPFIKYLRKK